MNPVKQMISLFIVIGACLGIAAFVLALTSKQNCDTKERYESSECNDDNAIKNKLNWFYAMVCTKPDNLPSPTKGGKAMCNSNCKKYDKICQQFCHTVAHDRSGGRGKSWLWDLDCYVNDKTNNDICGDDTDCRKNGGEPHMVSATAPVSLSVDSKSSNKHHSLAPGIIVLIIIAALVMLLTIRQMIINYAKA